MYLTTDCVLEAYQYFQLAVTKRENHLILSMKYNIILCIKWFEQEQHCYTYTLFGNIHYTCTIIKQ